MTWRRWLLLVVILVAITVGLIYWRSDREWQQMIVAVDAAELVLDARPGERPVLFGTATAGRAEPHYDTAIARIVEVFEQFDAETDPTGQLDEWLALTAESPAESVAARDRFLADIEPVWAALHEGAHRRDPRLTIEWQKGFSEFQPPVEAMIGLAHAAALRAQRLAMDDKHDAAVEVLLDIMQYGRDLVDDPRTLMSAIGGVVITIPIDKLFLRDPRVEDGKPPFAGRLQLTPSARAAFDLGLSRLDRQLPPLDRVVRAESVLLARQVGMAGGIASSFGGAILPAAWRYGFSSAWLVGDAVLRMLELADALPTPDQSWEQVNSVLVTQDGELRQSYNPLQRILQPNLKGLETGRRQALALVRMLRMSLAMDGQNDGQPPLVLADPFGGELRSEAVDGVVRFWSVDTDGKDDRGAQENDFVRIR